MSNIYEIDKSGVRVLDAVSVLVAESHSTAVGHGWWENDRSFGDQIALMHSELSEALEHYRNGHGPKEVWTDADGKPDGVAFELADVLIRIFDTCGRYGIPLGHALIKKLDYNRSRPYRHGGKTL